MIRFSSRISLAIFLSLAAFSTGACATQASAPGDAVGTDDGEGKADSGRAGEWTAGTGTSWTRAMNAVQYVTVPSGSDEDGGVCSGLDTQRVSLASVLSKYYYAPLNTGVGDVTDETRTIGLQFKQNADRSITYRLHISSEETYRGLDATDPNIEETFGTDIIIDFAANATAQSPVLATVQCAG